MASEPESPRIDKTTNTVVHIVESRQARPNLPAEDCPFCVGGLEAPQDYDVRWFTNRWPAMPGDRCEVVLYASKHDASLASIGVSGVRKVIDLWAERTQALGARKDVASVLIFENRGREVGATIDHPHGQIYAFDHVPTRSRQRLENKWEPDPSPERLVVELNGWAAYVPFAPVFSLSIEIAPLQRIANLATASPQDRDTMATLLVDVLGRIDELHGTPVPYMMWVNQQPTNQEFANAWMNIEIVSPWRAPNVARYIAAAEVGSGEYFNPVIPEELSRSLRTLRA
jgi:UDPglucose--hexose-1-phosphate uridylyltransferase